MSKLKSEDVHQLKDPCVKATKDTVFIVIAKNMTRGSVLPSVSLKHKSSSFGKIEKFMQQKLVFH